MEIKVSLLEGFKLSCQFDKHTVFSDQPVSNKGNDEFPSPYDYFLSSIALCAGYYVKSYCHARGIDTAGIEITQNNRKEEAGSYKQIINLSVVFPAGISDKDKLGILRSIEGCTVKKSIMAIPEITVSEA